MTPYGPRKMIPILENHYKAIYCGEMFNLLPDSNPWREQRNRLLSKWIGCPEAEAWILDYFDVAELFDDLIDKDKEITRDRIYQALFECMVDMPNNPFFVEHRAVLIPILHMGINCWMDSNALEKRHALEGLHFSYVMRAAYMAIIQTVVELVQGRDAMRDCSLEIVEFFGTETFAEYRAKFPDYPEEDVA